MRMSPTYQLGQFLIMARASTPVKVVPRQILMVGVDFNHSIEA